MNLVADTCYAALRARDRRFDGRFFVGVSSTGIYCRPVCTARPPRRENCGFFVSAAAAELAGYRPCLRCRPELAPGTSPIDATTRLARAAATWLDEHAGDDDALSGLTTRLGITDRHLRRVFRAEYGVAPVQYLQTQRLLFAKRLLTDTQLPVIQVALASGFQSLRRFNALFKTRYRLSPSRFRKGAKTRDASGELVFHLAYRAPYDWAGLLEFLSARTIPGVETVENGVYCRTVRVLHHGKPLTGALAVSLSTRPDCLAVRLSESLLPACVAVLERVKRQFDLAADLVEIQRVLGPLAEAHPGLRVPGSFDGFEMAVRAILGQQISVKGARTLAGRVVERFGTPGTFPFPGVTRIFPEAKTIAALAPRALSELGILPSRAQTLIDLAAAVANGKVRLHPSEPAENVFAELQRIRGIGDWTRQYLAMRGLSWPDAFPAGDLGIKKALNETSEAAVLRRAEGWRPWRSYAVLHLWRSLEKANLKQEK